MGEEVAGYLVVGSEKSLNDGNTNTTMKQQQQDVMEELSRHTLLF